MQRRGRGSITVAALFECLNLFFRAPRSLCDQGCILFILSLTCSNASRAQACVAKKKKKKKKTFPRIAFSKNALMIETRGLADGVLRHV